jgi:hypothetical protein
MSTQAQIDANRLNSQKSTGPSSPEGLAMSSLNRGRHFLSCSSNFRVLKDESQDEYNLFFSQILINYKPTDQTERDLLQRMAEHEWMRQRAQRLSNRMFHCDPQRADPLRRETHQAFALMLRYETMHERAYNSALSMLLKYRAEKKKEQIGFERKAAAAEQLQMRKQRHESAEKARQVDLHCKIIRTLRTSTSNPEALELARDLKTRHQSA